MINNKGSFSRSLWLMVSQQFDCLKFNIFFLACFKEAFRVIDSKLNCKCALKILVIVMRNTVDTDLNTKGLELREVVTAKHNKSLLLHCSNIVEFTWLD